RLKSGLPGTTLAVAATGSRRRLIHTLVAQLSKHSSCCVVLKRMGRISNTGMRFTRAVLCRSFRLIFVPWLAASGVSCSTAVGVTSEISIQRSLDLARLVATRTYLELPSTLRTSHG